jgi:hypothetical protein
MFDSLPMLRNTHKTATKDELDIYLGSDPENCDDALKWWDDRRDRFPHLAQMAINYLAIPGKSSELSSQ